MVACASVVNLNDISPTRVWSNILVGIRGTAIILDYIYFCEVLSHDQ